MSVAFRRDSDEEHREPRFELPLPPGPNLVTKRGRALIKRRNEELEAEIAAAATIERREALLRDLRYWRSRLATAEVIKTPLGDTIAIGTTVTIIQDGRTRLLEIVGHDESNPGTGRIAFGSPLAQALLGAEVGDTAEMPGRSDTMTVTAIEVTLD